MALSRVIEAYEGAVLIDGTDIASVDLDSLREAIAVIPQDPAILEGTLRFNLDPSGRSSESQILAIANSVSLGDLIKRDPLGLDQQITEMGGNLSCGEKQLICI